MNDAILKWVFRHAMLMLAAACAGMILQALWPVVLVMCLSAGYFIYSQYNVWSRLAPFGGYANYVTAARWILLLYVLLMRTSLDNHWFVALIVLVIIADGIDGYLARRFQSETEFGEVFDTEVDAFLALSLCMIIAMGHPTALWILFGGCLRYIFVIGYRLFGWQNRRRPQMPETKTFAVLYFLSLLSPWLMTWTYAVWILVAGTLLVSYSFLREFILMQRVRANRGGQ